MRTKPLTRRKMMIAPIIARHTVPLPPASDTPPSTTAVSAWNSQPTPAADAGMLRGLAAGADRGEMPAVARARQEDVADEKHGEQRRRIDRNAEHAGAAEIIPGVAVDRVGREHLGV